jgi:tetratricopeptide (TPR) repeat protein
MEKQSSRKTARSRASAKPVRRVRSALPLPSWLSRDTVLGLVLFFAVVLAYSPVWWAGYFWDDAPDLTANACIVGPLGLKEIWTTSAAQFYPLVLTTFWVGHALWGWAPLPYHLVNVLLHGASAVVLWRVLLSLQVPGALLGSTLWALHPVEVESVAWIAEMKNTESALFFLLSILFFVRWLKTTQSRKMGDWNYALTLLFAALAMASKSSTVILPLVLCLGAWWMQGRWEWRNLLKIGPIFIMSAVSAILALRTVDLQGVTTDAQWAISWPERLIIAGDAVWFYLGKLIWPHPLVVIYPRWEIDAGNWISYLPLLGVIVVLVILWLNRQSWARPWFFVFAYFLVALLPVLGFVNHFILRYSFVFDHFQYLASMGPLALAGAGIVRVSDLVTPGKYWLQCSLGAGLALILGLLSWQRATVYEDQGTLWADTLANNPNCWIGYINLGNISLQKGDIDNAIAQYQKALEINSNDASAHSDLGTAFLQKKEVDEAIAQYQKAHEINPTYALTDYNLGIAFIQKGEVDDAIAQFQKALEMNPRLPAALNSLGLALVQKGQLDEAITLYKKAEEIDPTYALVHNSLGAAYFKKGQMNEGLAQFQEALRLNPNDTTAQANLAKAQAMIEQKAASK